MKRVWTVIAILAVANILALGGFIGWLKMSDRLNKDRVEQVRKTFARTVAQEVSDKVAEAQATKDAEKKKAEDERMAQPPETAGEKIAKQKLDEEQKLQAIQRKQQELESLRTSLMSELSKLEEQEKRLKADKEAFAAERARIAQTEGEKQFKDALATLEGQKPKDAKQVLKALIDAKQKPQAVSYLAKMEEGKRSKVMAEFVKDDAALAAELLEQLRTRGTVVPAKEAADGLNKRSAAAKPAPGAGAASDQVASTGAPAGAGAGDESR